MTILKNSFSLLCIVPTLSELAINLIVIANMISSLIVNVGVLGMLEPYHPLALTCIVVALRHNVRLSFIVKSTTLNSIPHQHTAPTAHHTTKLTPHTTPKHNTHHSTPLNITPHTTPDMTSPHHYTTPHTTTTPQHLYKF